MMFRLYLLIFLAFSASLSPVWAQNEAPKAGEIALEGRVTALDAPHHTLDFLVTAFTNPGGRRAFITAPKVRVARVSLATVFFQSEGKKVSLGDFKVGEEVRVVGKNGDDSAVFEARAVGWSAEQIALDNLHALPSIASLLPAPQKAFATSLRLANVKWTRQDAEYNGLKEKTPVFTSTWEFQSPWPKSKDDGGFMMYPQSLARLVGLHAPDGTALEAMIPDNRTGSGATPTQLFLRSADVDPQWPFISVEWEIFDPIATTEAGGRRSSLVTWKKLDFPTKRGQKIAVNRTVATPSGTEINLVSIERVAGDSKTDPEQFLFFLKVEPGEEAPDAELQFSFDHLSSATATYRSKSPNGSGGFDGSLFYLRSGVAAPQNAGPLSLSLRADEKSISLQDRSHFKRLKFQIPVAPVWNAPPVPAIPDSPIFPIETAHVKGQLESVRVDNNRNWRALLWLQAPAATSEAEVPIQSESAVDWRYFLRGGNLLKSNGNTSKLWVHASDENTRFVHLDGTRAAPGARSHLLTIWADVPPPYDLTLSFERGRRLAHSQTLKEIAIPQTKSIATTPSDTKQFFQLRRVFRYQDLREIAGLNDSERKLLAPAGVAVLLELSPNFAGAETQIEAVRAIDQDGRQWSEGWQFRRFIGDVTQPKSLEIDQAAESTSRFFTVFLPGFGATTKQFSLELSAIETQWGGETETAKVHLER